MTARAGSATDWHGSEPCPECGVARMVAGEPRCRPCALAAAERFAQWFADNVIVKERPDVT